MHKMTFCDVALEVLEELRYSTVSKKVACDLEIGFFESVKSLFDEPGDTISIIRFLIAKVEFTDDEKLRLTLTFNKYALTAPLFLGNKPYHEAAKEIFLMDYDREAAKMGELYCVVIYCLLKMGISKEDGVLVFRALLRAIKNFREIGSPEHGLEDMSIQPCFASLCAKLISQLELWHEIQNEVRRLLSEELSEKTRIELRNLAEVIACHKPLFGLVKEIYSEVRR